MTPKSLTVQCGIWHRYAIRSSALSGRMPLHNGVLAYNLGTFPPQLTPPKEESVSLQGCDARFCSGRLKPHPLDLRPIVRPRARDTCSSPQGDGRRARQATLWVNREPSAISV